MSVKEYFYDLNWAPYGWDKDDHAHIQDAVLGFLLRSAEIMELTAYPLRTQRVLGFFVFKDYTAVEELDRDYVAARNHLKPFELKKVTNDQKHGVAQGGEVRFHHYFYRLAPELCAMLVDAGLIWTRDCEFCGFEDPAFYRPDGTLLARIVTREKLLSFFLSVEELRDLEKRGIALTERLEHY